MKKTTLGAMPHQKELMTLSNEIFSMKKDGLQWDDLVKHITLNCDYLKFKETLKITISDKNLIHSLVHRSFMNEIITDEVSHNERLEFIGDSVLNLAMSEILYQKFPEMAEGELSKLRSALVNAESLIDLSKNLNLYPCILMGQGELNATNSLEKNLVSDVLEAVLGAVFLEQGFNSSKELLKRMLSLYDDLNEGPFISIERLEDYDAKTKLQELTMAKYKEIPVYKSTDIGNREFNVEIYLKGVLLAKTNLDSKKRAMKLLARKVLKEKLFEKIEEPNRV